METLKTSIRIRWTEDHTAIAVMLAFQQAAHELGRPLTDPVNDNDGAKLVFEILDRWNIPPGTSLFATAVQTTCPTWEHAKPS